MTDAALLMDKIHEDRISYGHVLYDYLALFPGLSREQALAKILQIWQQEGKFVDHKELFKVASRDMIAERKYDAQTAGKLESFANDTIEAAYPADKLTGFYDKNSAPVLEALAHLYYYAQKSNGVDYDIETLPIDINNITGINQQFEKELNDDSNGWKECDDVISVAFGILKETLDEYAKTHGGQVLYSRSGGDEFRIHTMGIPADVVARAKNDAHRFTEPFYCEAKVHRTPHPKYLGNKYKQGMLLGVGQVRLDDRDPMVLYELQESSVSASKVIQGYHRHGDMPDFEEEALRAEMTRLGMDQEDIEATIDGAKDDIRRQAEENETRSQRPGNSVMYIKNMPSRYRAFLPPYQPPALLPFDSHVDLANDKRRRFRPSSEILRDNAIFHLRDAGVPIDDFVKSLTKAAIGHYSANDFSSNARSDRTLESDMQCYQEDADRETHDMGIDQKAKILYVECGNLQGLNHFGHHIADRVLQHEVEIIKDVLKKYHIENSEAVYSKGGGVFLALIPSRVQYSKDPPMFKETGNDFITSIQEEIAERVDKEINQQPIFDYFKKRGLPLRYHKDSKYKGIVRLPSPDGKTPGLPILYSEKGKRGKRTRIMPLFSELMHPRRAGVSGVTVVHSGYQELAFAPDKVKNFLSSTLNAFKGEAALKLQAIEKKALKDGIITSLSKTVPNQSVTMKKKNNGR